MKNKLVLVGIIAVSVLIGLSILACDTGGGSPGVTVTKIEITQEPDNLVYEIAAAALDLKGLEVTAFYSDNTTKTLESSEYTVTGFTAGKSGQQTITVSYAYKGKTVRATFEITVMSLYGGIHVLFNDFYDEDIHLSGAGSTLNLFTSQTLTVTITGDYDEYIWYLNGEFMGSDAYSNSFSVTGNDEQINRVGPYTITAIVKLEEFYYSKTLTFTVVRN